MGEYSEQLKTWRSLNDFLKKCTEEEAYKALQEEMHHKRPYFALRIYARFNALREQRERADLMRAVGQSS